MKSWFKKMRLCAPLPASEVMCSFEHWVSSGQTRLSSPWYFVRFSKWAILRNQYLHLLRRWECGTQWFRGWSHPSIHSVNMYYVPGISGHWRVQSPVLFLPCNAQSGGEGEERGMEVTIPLQCARWSPGHIVGTQKWPTNGSVVIDVWTKS